MTSRYAFALAVLVESIGLNEMQRIHTCILFGLCGTSFAAAVLREQRLAAFVFGSPAVFNMMRVDVPVAVVRQRINRCRRSRSMGIPEGRFREIMVPGLQMASTRDFVRMTESEGH